ncbi:transmembrane secretion effector [Solirubrobacter pauli]|uniref:Transmembrane secretion effector n=1 Tax=Solirubrobacter pauli TaxID=166793 RepID=A0A660LDV3_9ACTN|nr:MFS transporter [Solirubrobacter pauli]RKQ93258.1 transmembrane secretion effector [Solirubrobacter pauli]
MSARGPRRSLYGWLAADGVSLVGTRVSMVALPLFVLTTTGSPQKTGLVAVAELVPLVLLKVLGGPVIDRAGARAVALTCDGASVLVVGAMPLLHDAGVLSFPAFLALVAVAGGLRGPGDAAKHALIPTLSAAAAVPMERVTGLSATVERTASMLGAALAGVLVAVAGPANALLVDAASFGGSALVLAWAVPAGTRGPREAQEEGAPYGERLRAGWRFLRGDRVLVGITAMVALTNLLDVAWSAVLVPVWGVERAGGAGAVGALFATSAGAAAIGALLAAAYAERLPRHLTYLVCFLVAGLPRFAVVAFDAPLGWVLAVAGVAGFAAGFLNPILGAVIYERVPAHLVGRVSSLSTATCFALMPLGGLIGGFLVASAGLGTALLICGLAYLVVTLLPAVDPRWRELDATPSGRPRSSARRSAATRRGGLRPSRPAGRGGRASRGRGRS